MEQVKDDRKFHGYLKELFRKDKHKFNGAG